MLDDRAGSGSASTTLRLKKDAKEIWMSIVARGGEYTLDSKHAVPRERLNAFGNGPYAPVASNKTEEGRAKNRRVELVEIATT